MQLIAISHLTALTKTNPVPVIAPRCKKRLILQYSDFREEKHAIDHACKLI